MSHRLSGLARIASLLASLLAVSGCTSNIHRDFLPNLIRDASDNGSIRNPVVRLAYDGKGKYLVVGHESGNIDVWDAKEPRSKREIKAHDYRANWITFASDGSSFFSNSAFESSTKLWSLRTGELLHSIPDTRGPVGATPDESIYLVGHSSQIRIFDAETRALLPEKFESSGVVLVMALDVASQRIAVGTASGTIEIWKFSRDGGRPGLQKAMQAKPYPTGNWVVGLQFSPDGASLYSVARSGAIDEWTARSLERRRALSTTLRHIYSVAFYRNRELLALGGTEDAVGVGKGFVELISLTAGTSTTHRASNNLPVVEFLPPLDTLISAQSGSMEAYALPPHP
jgi:WD40 repeat protein